MSNGTTAASIATSLSGIFANLTPGQLGRLGHHLTTSDEMRALMILNSMEQNPGLAPSLLPSLSMIPNLPDQVMTWVTAAMATPANFGSNMAQAKVALQTAATNPGILGSLGL
ncbi:MAG TPA: hypothetical protein VNU19_07395 [Candidatus Acidoferrum sp.]|jgi:hypothetical protein|nr:hypothetical protein [Candidatus Acidoferrum sp.]